MNDQFKRIFKAPFYVLSYSFEDNTVTRADDETTTITVGSFVVGAALWSRVRSLA